MNMLHRLTTHGWLLIALAATLLAALPAFGLSAFWINQLIVIAVYTLIVSGMNLTLGYAGELSLGQVAFFAAGSYVTAILAVNGIRELLVALVASMVVAGLLGLIVSLPAFRLGGWPLALSSFFLVLLIPDILQILEPVTNGRSGIVGVFNPTLLGIPLGRNGYFAAVILITVLWLGALRNVVRSRYGMSLQILKQSPQLASSLAVSVPRSRFSAYVIGALPAGIAGCLFAYSLGVVNPGSFSLGLVLSLFAASVVGGSRSIWGAPLGAAILVLGPMQTQSLEGFSTVAFGVFLILVGVLMPGGLAGLISRGWHKFTAAKGPGPNGGPDAARPPAGKVPGIELRFPGRKLIVEDVKKQFGGLKALDGAGMVAPAGKVTALIGPNGAGKTTLLNTISGFITMDEGRVQLGDTDLTGMTADAVTKHGVARTFQTPRIPAGFTVLEVVMSGLLRVGRLHTLEAVLRLPSFRRQREQDARIALEVLRFAGLEHMAQTQADALPLGTRRLLEVVRALAGAPGVVLLDEPAAGLDEEALEGLRALIEKAREAGATVVLVEHNVPFVMSVADEVAVLNMGRPLVQGTPDEVRKHPDVIDVYLGRSAGGERGPKEIIAATPEAESSPPMEPVFGAEGIAVGYGDLTVVRDVSLSLTSGRTTALFGRNGAGKSTLLTGLAGLLPLGAGKVLLGDKDITATKPWNRAAMGLGLVPEGKRVFRGLTVQENLTISVPKGLTREEHTDRIEAIYTRFPVLRDRRNDRAGSLSGGQQQMLALGSAMVMHPRALLIDEPSSGLAPVVVDDLLDAITHLKSQGMAILLVEQLVEEVMDGHADDVVVLDGGRVVLARNAATVSVDEIASKVV
jgi:branched-chain amino acid transport system permease protein